MVNSEEKRIAEFSRLLTESRNRVFGYIYSMLHNAGDAEDVHQQVTIVMWNKFDQFQEGTSFVNWALAIAHNKIKQFHAKKGRERICFSDEVMKAVAETYSSMDERHASSDRLDGLLCCLGKLHSRQRKLLQMRYAEGMSIRELAEHESKSEGAVVMVFARLRKTLHACITQAMERAS